MRWKHSGPLRLPACKSAFQRDHRGRGRRRRARLVIVEGDVAIGAGLAGGLDGFEREQLLVHHVRGHDVGHGREDVVDAARVALLPLVDHGLDLHALQVLLAAAKVARNDRELAVLGPAHEVGLLDIGQRADDDVLAVVADQLGRHALHAAAEEHVQEQRRDDVVAVVAQGDLGAAQLAGHAVQDAPAQPRAQAAGGLALGHHALHHRVGVLLLDVEGHAAALQVGGQHVLREAGLLLVEVHRHQLEPNRRALLQVQQDVQHRVAVLAAGQADHDLVAFFDHVEVGNGLADLAVQPLGQLVDLVRVLLGRLVFGGGSQGVVEDVCIHGGRGVRGAGHQRPVSALTATSQSGKISSLVSFTRTPTTPGRLIRRLQSLPTRASTRSVCSVVHSSMMAARTRR
mmetsp:Transcript_18070/g.43154  ORF Transcript_18070/g.43154 Transcript_18070/m.43154 type:complete len:400 (-) Transcript_18070:358-1557(-)